KVDEKAWYSAFKISKVKTGEPKAMVSVDSMLNWNEHEVEHKPKEGEQVYSLMAGFKSDFADPAVNAAGSVKIEKKEWEILPKSGVTDPSPLNGVSSCSIKENVKPPSNLCNKRRIAAGDTHEVPPSITGTFMPTSSNSVLEEIQKLMTLHHVFQVSCPLTPSLLLTSMTGNKDKLDDFVQVKGGTVTFGGRDGKITGKETEGCLDGLGGLLKVVGPTAAELGGREGGLGESGVGSWSGRGEGSLIGVGSLTGTTNMGAKSGIWGPSQFNFILENNLAVKSNVGRGEGSELNKKVKAIRCDNGTEFRNAKLIALCREKGIKRDYSNARTPQQNGFDERKNRTHIEAARSMLADSKLPTMFWTEAVSTTCYVLNRVSITSPHIKTPYELLSGKISNIRHLKPFGCQVTILNTSDHLGKFEGKANDGFLVGYAAHSKAYRVYNLSSKKVEEMLNLRYLEDKPNVQDDTNILVGTQADDSDSECDEQVILVPSFLSNSFSGPTVQDVSAPIENNLDYAEELARLQRQEYEAHSTAAKHGFEFFVDTAALLPQANIEIRRNLVPAASDHAGGIVTTGGVPVGSDPAGGIVPTGRVLAGSSIPASDVLTSSILARSVPAGGVLVGSLVPTDSATSIVPAASVFVPAVVPTDSAANSPLPPVYSLGSCAHSTRFPSPSDLGNHQHTAGIFSSSSYDDDFYADVTNLDLNVAVDPVATKRVNSVHPQYHILGDLQSPVQTRSTVQKSKFGESAFISFVQNQFRTNHADHLHCLFICFLSQLEPSSVATALADPDWVAAMQEEMQHFYHKQVWKLVPLPAGKIAISTKWILKNKRDARGIMCDEFEVLIKGEFELSAMGELTFFLGLQVKQLSDGIFISQDKYVKDMLKKFDMESVRTATTPYEVPKHKSKDEPNDAVNVHLFRSMIGSFVYLIASRPYIMFAVSACYRHQVSPLTSHLNAVKKIFKYLKGQPNLGLWYPRDSLFQLEAYSDSDYAGSHGDRKSTTGGC
nr:ribonuclease H-like domain, reverse transcriptase, RNA-dependent DNA polymerase [Tanacetum cinerariifolium]